MFLRPRLGLWLSLCSIATRGVSPQRVPATNLDLSDLGQVTIAGDFDAISLYEYFRQKEGFNGNGAQSVIEQLPSGALGALGATDASIEAMCPFMRRDGSMIGLIIGGNFTSVGGIGAQSVALIDPAGNISPHPGIQGTVSAMLCDSDTETVYVGGSFEAAASTNAIAWIAAGSWANLPFAGFDAPVTSITKAPNGHIIFGGSFTGLGNMTVSANASEEAIQVVNLATASVTSLANATSGHNIVCPSNGTNDQPWLLKDNSPGYWQADLHYGFEPGRLRLHNTHQDGRGTKTWRLTALPINGIMNFTYTDPETGEDAFCDATCPLSDNSSLPYQDFYFVNRVGMNSFRIDVSEWYGKGGGLAGVEIFQSDIFAYAVNAFNEPACTGTSDLVSTATTTGPWYVTPSRDSNADYLTAVVGPATIDSTQIVLEPDVKESGNYSIIVYTPGCRQDSSCSARAIVNVTGTLTTDNERSFLTQLYQTNYNDKYDVVYQGRVDAGTGSFRPQITITASGLQQDQLLVASRVRFSLVNSTGGLNGLFDFDPNSAVVDTNFSASAINNAGTMLKPNAHVISLASNNKTIYAAGSFSDDKFENIMAFADNQATSLPSGGLNAAVTDMYSSDDFLYVVGNFTGTNREGPSGLNNIAAYSYAEDAWVALGAGVNGPVDSVDYLPMNTTQGQPETVIVFSGSFSAILASGSAPQIRVDGLAIWVPSRSSWLNNLDIPKQFYVGQLRISTTLINGTWLGAGSLMSLGEAVSGAVGLRSSSDTLSLQRLPVSIQSGSTNTPSNITRNQVSSGQQNTTGVVVGLVSTGGGRNLTVLGGHFTVETNSSTIRNLLFLDGGRNNGVAGLPPGIDDNSTFVALAEQNSLLFAGGAVTGEASDVRVNGLIVYDFGSSSFRSPQPAALVGDDVIVNSITPQDGTSNVYVGGAFHSTAQGLPCSSVCMYDTSSNLWSTVGGNLDGVVTALYWTDKTHMLAAGNLSIGNNVTSLARYDSKSQSWTGLTTDAIPGPVTAFAASDAAADGMWIAGTAADGSTYLMEVDGTNSDHMDYHPVVDAFGSGTTIRGLQVMSLTKNHNANQYLDNDRALLVTGQLNLTNFGFASAALFNGSTMTPFLLASDAEGNPATVSQLFSSERNPVLVRGNGHSNGITVLVAFCAALGTVFLIVLLGMILNRIQRRRAGYSTVPSAPYADKNSNINRVPPERLFGTLGQKNGGAPAV